MLCSGIAVCIFLTACGGRYSIRAGDDLVASREGVTSTTNMVTTEFENPVLTGLVTVPGLRLESDSRGRPTTCCRRMLMQADHDVFTSPFLSVTEISAGAASVFNYSLPAVSMPVDGSPVRFALFDGVEQVAGSVRLSDRVIVLPVHIHVFTQAGGQVDPVIRRERVFAWFERPAFSTESQTIHSASTGATETYLVTTPALPRIYSNVDDIWHQALIQFRLETYDTIENPEMERQILSSSSSSTTWIPRFLHDDRFRDIPGIHIYLGRDSEGLLTEGQTRTVGCETDVRSNNAIALAWNDARDESNVLAHELGHYLGLQHTNDGSSLSCGALLLDSSGARSLMEINALDTTISSRQAERARAFACMYLRLWGVASPACP